ncbi:hypothetical protein SCANM63S_03590 [Streptomyces canarius]
MLSVIAEAPAMVMRPTARGGGRECTLLLLLGRGDETVTDTGSVKRAV